MCLFIQKVSKQLHVNYIVIEEASLIILDELAIFKENVLQNHPHGFGFAAGIGPRAQGG